MKNLLSILFLLLASTAYAQLNDLMKDKNVAWVATASMDVRVDMLYDEQVKRIYDAAKYDLTGGLDIMKFQENKDVNADEGHQLFANMLLKAAKNKQIKGFADSECLQPTDITSLITRIDTITQVNPDTYETVMKVVVNDLNWEDIHLFRLYQIVYYKPQNGTWGVKTVSIAPLIMRHDDMGNFLNWTPLFWMKVDDKKVKLNSSDITWAVRTRSRTPQSGLNLTTVKEYKKLGLGMPMKHFLNAANTDTKMPLYSTTMGWQQKELLSFDERERLFISQDTIQTVDPITYETKVRIVKNTLNPESIDQARLIQEWAWNNKSKSLSVRLVGVAPMKEVLDDAHNFLFRMPLFYRRFED